MKKRLLILPLLAATALASCAGSTPVGTYKFQLGSDKGTHMGLFMELTNEDVTEPESTQVLGKKFTLSMDMKGMDEESSSQSSMQPILELNSNFKFYGYYNIGGKDESGLELPGDRLSLGTTMIEDFFEIPAFNIPPSLVEKILYATIDGNSKVNIVIPVSLRDLQFQLYWYGLRIDETTLDISTLSWTNPVGTHPTKDDIQRIRDYEATQGGDTNPFREYRDYHCLTMGLAK